MSDIAKTKAEQLRIEANQLILKAEQLDGKSISFEISGLSRREVDEWLRQEAELSLSKHYRLNPIQIEQLKELWPVVNKLDITIEQLMPLMDLIWLSWLHKKYNGNPNQFMISAGAEMASRIHELTKDINKVMSFGAADHYFISTMNSSLKGFN